MRKPTYLSFSSMTLHEKDQDEFYLKYLCENRPGRLPQTGPMCVGSSFDAYVKSALQPLDPENKKVKSVEIPIGSSVSDISGILARINAHVRTSGES